MNRTLLTLWMMVSLLTIANAQGQEEARQQYLREQAMLKRMMLDRELDSGVYYMDQGEYKKADAKFRYVLANIQGVPSDLAFHFGKNSYLLRSEEHTSELQSRENLVCRLLLEK